jgi:NifU-like protein involved in Fe-S cluster formation
MMEPAVPAGGSINPLPVKVLSYSPLVVEHFARPRNVGSLAPAPDVIRAAAGSVEQGVRFEFTARVAGGRLSELRQRVYGCPHAIAAASWVVERLAGATRDELARWRWREAAEALAVPADKRGRLLVLEDALRALGEAWDRLDAGAG